MELCIHINVGVMSAAIGGGPLKTKTLKPEADLTQYTLGTP